MKKEDLIKIRGHRCEGCGRTKWKGQPIPLVKHHENPPSEKLEDVFLYCGNCHALTKNFCGKGIKSFKNVTDDEVRDAVEKSKNLRQLLLNLDLVPKGANYESIRKRLKRLNLLDKYKTNSITKLCISCGELISRGNEKFCSRQCANRFHSVTQKQRFKIVWPPLEVLELMVKENGFLPTGKYLGVSDNAVRKHLKKLQKL